MPITDGMSSSRSLIPLFIVTIRILRMGTIPVSAKKGFCWVIWIFTVVASVDRIKS